MTDLESYRDFVGYAEPTLSDDLYDRGEDYGDDIDPAWCWWCMMPIIPTAADKCPHCGRPASDLPDPDEYDYDLSPLTGDPFEEA